MKVKKKTAIVAGLALGALLVGTAAFADIASKSGYDQLKDSLKVTADKCSNQFDSFTLDLSFVIKDNGKTLQSGSDVKKFDRRAGASEDNSSTTSEGIGTTNFYTYSDQDRLIQHSAGGDDTYNVIEYTQARKTGGVFDDPFKKNGFEDVEKIVDALVGNLKDYVMVADHADGSKELSGSLSEVQIPPLINALASFQAKQTFSGHPDGIPKLTQDIFVKEVKGSALLSPEGILENILGTAVLSGKDDQGQTHEITLEILGKVSGINATTVAAPDLTGKKVVKNIAQPPGTPSQMADPQKYIGKFKNDIITERNGKFVKLGERTLEITQMDGQTVTGRYHEEYKPEYQDEAAKEPDFTFKAEFKQNQGPYNAEIVESSNNVRGTISFSESPGKLYLGIVYLAININGAPPPNFDSEFNIDLP